MNLDARIARARGLTPSERQMAQTVVLLGERLRTVSIKEFARAAHVSIASVHRFCKKLGLEGYKELKVEVARTLAARAGAGVDVNFPFGAGEPPERIVSQMGSLYAATIRTTRDVVGEEDLARAAELLTQARRCGVFTQSHNLYPARMFCDRMVSVGRDAFCHETIERQYQAALGLGESDVALVISYSGLAPEIPVRLRILASRGVPVIFVGTQAACERHPGLDTYLRLADLEDAHDRITQFASHLAVQFVLDVLFGCVFTGSYEESASFLASSAPYLSQLQLDLTHAST